MSVPFVSNQRKTVWFSKYEPKNKYDLWLSKNKHIEYDENGDEIESVDNDQQRDCDYIMKIWDCGSWHPIVGFNTTAANKINIVEGNIEHNPAIFTGSNPDDLQDCGSFTDILSGNTDIDIDWETIIDSDSFTYAWNIVIGGGNLGLWPAESNRLGGIMMNTFSSVDLLHFSEIKYYNNNNKHPFADVSDIVDIINSGNAGTIDVGQIGGSSGVIDTDILYRSFYNSPSIRKGWTESQGEASAQKPRFELNGSTTLENRGKFLKLKDPDDSWWSSTHNDYGETDNCFDWVDLSDWFDDNYELPLASLGQRGGIRADRHAGLSYGKYIAECKLYNPSYVEQNSYRREALCVDIRDVKQALDDWYADDESTIWDLDIQSNFGINTMKQESVDDENVTHVAYAHVLDHYTTTMKDGLYPRNKTYSNPVPGLYNGTKGLEWVNAQTIVEEGLGISSGTGYLYYNGGFFVLDPGTGGGGGETTYYPLSSSNYNTAGNYVIGVSSGGTGGANRYLNGLGQWTTPANTTYDDFSGSSHGLVPASTSSSQDKFLKGDGTWGTPSVSAEFDIDMVSSVRDDYDFVLNNLRLTSTSTTNPLDITLKEWGYYNVNGGDKTTEFTFSNTHVSGNAAYIRFNTSAQSVLINTDTDIIFSNESMGSSRKQFAANSSYLITIQFGIIKIEKITTNSSIYNSSISSDSQN